MRKITSRLPSFAFLLCLCLSAIVAATANVGPPEQRTMAMPGSYSAIRDLENERVAAAADFAASEALSSSLMPAKFSFGAAPGAIRAGEVTPIIVRGFQQVVAGMNYKLVIVLVKKQDSTTHQPDDGATAEPALQEIVGGFGVTVYDHFGELSVTKWGKELSQAQAMALLENRNEFGEEANPFDE